MRGVYEVSYKITGLTTARTLCYWTAPAKQVVEILSASATDANNLTNQQLEVVFQKIATLGTPTATAVTPSKSEQGDQATPTLWYANVTANEPSYTANTQYGYRAAASLGGWEFAPVPEERLYGAATDSWGLRLLTAITSQDTIIRISARDIG